MELIAERDVLIVLLIEKRVWYILMVLAVLKVIVKRELDTP
jgi:hypothetical protein